MKPFARELTRGSQKYSTQDHSQHQTGRTTEYPDKSSVWSSRPSQKRVARNANRAQKKSARTRLKKELKDEQTI